MAQSQIPLLFPLLAKWFIPSLESAGMFLSLACFAPLYPFIDYYAIVYFQIMRQSFIVERYAWSTYRTVGDTCDALGMAHFYTIPPQKPKEEKNTSTPSDKVSGKSAK